MKAGKKGAAIAALLLINFCCINAFSQDLKDSLTNRYLNYSRFSSPEKLYLHTDKSLYIAGEYIWFRGYLENSSALSEMAHSNFIYVELYSDTLISRVKIKKSEDGFAGQLPLAHNLKSGEYTLRGYTTWMMNSNPEFMFHKQISLINPTERSSRLVTTPGVTRTTTNSSLLNIKATEVKQTGEAGEQSADTLGSVQFFPESGRYLADRFAVIAFKATDTKGRGFNTEGALYNRKDSLIAHLVTEHNGMGVLRFLPISGESYYILASNGKGDRVRFNLPQPESEGAVINLRNRDGKIFINTNISDLFATTGVTILIHNGDSLFLCEDINRQEKTFILKQESLAPGINHILIVDRNSKILSERLFFVYPKSEVIVSLVSKNGDETTGTRESAGYTLQLKDSLGNPLKGKFSVSVTDSFLSPYDSLCDNFKSYMLLSSEIRGAIENPAYYFMDDSLQRARAMDLLMMVQGWRYYDLPAILSAQNSSAKRWYEKEFTQQITGRATSTFRNTKRSTLSVLAPEIGLAVSEPLNKTGKFTVTDLNFPDSTNFILSCTGKEGQKGYYLDIEEQKFPPVGQYSFIKKRESVLDPGSMMIYTKMFYDTGGSEAVTLNAAVISSSPKVAPKYNPSPFNQYFDRRQLRERSELDLYSGMSLLDYIVGNFPGLMYGPTGDDGQRTVISTRSFNITGDPGVPLLFINRAQVQSTGDLDMYTVDDVENVAFLKGNDGFMFRTLSGVILVTLRYAAQNKDVSWYFNTKLLSPLGWQKPSKFYSPDYSLAKDNEAIKYDTRTTLFWDPAVRTDDNGIAKILFYTSDRKTRLNIVIEGTTSTGEYISIVR